MVCQAELAADDYAAFIQAIKNRTVESVYPGARIEYRPTRYYNMVVIFDDGSMLPIRTKKP